MEESPVIEINAAKRILRQKGALSGGIFTGTDKVRSGYGNGDCLYFDFRHRVFAVADGTERFPCASRDILVRLSDALTQFGVPGTAGDCVYAGQKYQHKTTFSCVAVRDDDDGIALTVAHGGDSAVMALDATSGAVLFQTERNMVFAGRSLEIVDVTEHRLMDRNVRLALFSDGFDDLFRFCMRQSVFCRLSDAFITLPADHVGEQLHRMVEQNCGEFEHDDISCIVMDPFRLADAGESQILIGGTQPHEEKRFRAGNGNGGRDCWVPERTWASAKEVFLQSGITIQ
jgi:hypothetical protein